ncbi:unnamed protein product [Candidula unifasciata]|uniref:Nuclear receptor 2C2-associated protein n=1 Tax=Candidula unifasciata TaxID=100452 RepID=A0A8S3ZRU2_9EUPU|nr:unnamed protein product [Candidula unifasciata]
MADTTCSLAAKICRSRVSSVLNKDTKQFGKNNLFDNSEETCWNSDQGSPQWILLEFGEEVCVKEIHIQFHGGFVGKNCWLESSQAGSKDLTKFHSFYPQDINQTQVFSLPEVVPLSSLKIVFDDSTDFFGRITIYKLDILGKDS